MIYLAWIVIVLSFLSLLVKHHFANRHHVKHVNKEFNDDKDLVDSLIVLDVIIRVGIFYLAIILSIIIIVKEYLCR